MKHVGWALPLGLATSLVLGLPAARADSLAPGSTVRVNGIDMYYEVQGAGEPLVLLHPFGGCTRTWQPVADRLGAEYRLIVPDLRGHGRSSNPQGTFSHRQSAADVFALLDQMGVKRFRAMGISTGGMTLLHMATQQPERVDAMVLIGATSYFPEQARAIMRQVSPDAAPPPIRARYATCAVRGESQIRELLTHFGGFKDSYDDMNFTAPYLATVKARTLIVHGDRDAFFPVAIPVEMYRAIPRSALWIIPHGDHVPIFGSHAREFQDVALEFLRGEPPR